MSRAPGLVALLALGSACAEAPTATLVFSPLGDPDNCAASEAEIVAGTGIVWLGLRRDEATFAATCVSVEGATGWEDLEGALVEAGALIADLPIGAPLAPFVMGLPLASPCPAGDPSGGIRFCGRAAQPFVIDAESGAGTVEVERICSTAWSAQDCFGD